MRKIGKILMSGLIIGLVSTMVFCATNIVNASPRFEEGPPSGSTQSQTVYDYPGGWGEAYAAFFSRVWVYPSYLEVVEQNLTTNLLTASRSYGTTGRTHYCNYSGMAPNWTQINSRVSASY